MSSQITISKMKQILEDMEKKGYGDRLLIVAADQGGHEFYGLHDGITLGESLGMDDEGYIYDSETIDPEKIACIGQKGE